MTRQVEIVGYVGLGQGNAEFGFELRARRRVQLGQNRADRRSGAFQS